jgi:hypothetical protein
MSSPGHGSLPVSGFGAAVFMVEVTADGVQEPLDEIAAITKIITTVAMRIIIQPVKLLTVVPPGLVELVEGRPDGNFGSAGGIGPV